MKHAKRLFKNQISADELVEKLLGLSKRERICLLDSCGVSHLGSHFLIAGINPFETFEISGETAEQTLRFLDEKLENPETFAIFTISYDFGLKLEKITPRKKLFSHDEPDIFLAIFDCLVIHDYDTGETFLFGSENRFPDIENLISEAKPWCDFAASNDSQAIRVGSNFTKAEYLAKIEKIKEFIRDGDTYQTNLTQQFTAELPENFTAQQIFYNLRKNHPAPFASLIQRNDSVVISASPERFFKIEPPIADRTSPITTSPIKGTRPRGQTAAEDEKLKKELLDSEKDRAENVMIVDLLRNDLGRICEFGSVTVEKLCEIEQHPSLYHLVSTVTGNLRASARFSDVIRAVFPCGSITGAPKIRTMQIIDELETATRGLSMGAIGYTINDGQWTVDDGQNFLKCSSFKGRSTDLSVAIRTMTVKNRKIIFNVGGGIVIDSIAEDEYQETLTKAKALLISINGEFK